MKKTCSEERDIVAHIFRVVTKSKDTAKFAQLRVSLFALQCSDCFTIQKILIDFSLKSLRAEGMSLSESSYSMIVQVEMARCFIDVKGATIS